MNRPVSVSAPRGPCQTCCRSVRRVHTDADALATVLQGDRFENPLSEIGGKHARPHSASELDKVTEDPHMIAMVGDLRVRMSAADAMLERAAHYVERAGREPTEANFAEASIAVAEAKIITNDVSLLVFNKLFEIGGHARSARTSQSRHLLAQRTDAHAA